MDKKFAGIGSTVRFITTDDNEFNEVKLVKIARELNEVSENSKLGEALMLCVEGEVLTVNSVEPYEIKIINIVNPVEKQKHSFQTISASGEPVLIENFIPASTGNYANLESDIRNGLVECHAYGRKAKDIYLAGCENFGWSYSKLGSFCSQKLLYDKNCSREGYSVWFLPYSNLNNYKNSMANWINLISSDFNVIKENWKVLDDRFFYDKDMRITFAKQKNGQYLYLGIFQAKEFDEVNKVKTFYKVN